MSSGVLGSSAYSRKSLPAIMDCFTVILLNSHPSAVELSLCIRPTAFIIISVNAIICKWPHPAAMCMYQLQWQQVECDMGYYGNSEANKLHLGRKVRAWEGRRKRASQQKTASPPHPPPSLSYNSKKHFIDPWSCTASCQLDLAFLSRFGNEGMKKS